MPYQEQASPRPTLPLSLLLDEHSFGAILLTPGASDDEAIAEVRKLGFALAIVVELTDPTPYLTPGDLLLITGLGLPSDHEGISSYVARVKQAGVVGLVMGLEPVYSSVPETLIEACREHALPLIQLPPPVYFASVVAFVTRALESERVRSLSAMVNAAQHLTEATMQTDPLQRLLTVLVRECGGWAVIHNEQETFTRGQLPDGLALQDLLADLQHRLEPQLRQSGTPTAFTTVSAGGIEYEVTAHFARNPRHVLRSSSPPPLLMLGKAPRLTNSDRTALLLATTLAGIVEHTPAEQSMAVDQLLMHFLIDVTTASATSRVRSRATGLLASALGPGSKTAYAVIAERLDEQHGIASIADIAWLRRLLQTPFVEQRGRRLRAFTAKPPSRTDLEHASELGWTLAISRSRELAELPQAMHEAEELGRIAKRLGKHITGHDPEEFSRVWGLAAITDPGLGDAAAALWLAPLDGEQHAEKRAALVAWLYRHGSWDRTARDLSLHRNTVRRLVAAAGEQLGRDLEDPVERARLLLAFTVTDPQAPA